VLHRKQQPATRQHEDRATVFVAAEAHVRRGLEPAGGGIEHFGTRIDAFVVALVRTGEDEDATIVERDAVMLVAADAHLSRLLKSSRCWIEDLRGARDNCAGATTTVSTRNEDAPVTQFDGNVTLARLTHGAGCGEDAGARVEDRGLDFTRLPYTRAEVTAIRSLFPAGGSRL